MPKGILINPTLRKIEYVQIPAMDSLRALQKCVGGSIEGVGYINRLGKVAGFKDNYIYCHDEGAFDETTDFVFIKGYAQQFYKGNLLVIGSDGEGGNTNVKMTIKQAINIFKMIPKEMVTTNY